MLDVCKNTGQSISFIIFYFDFRSCFFCLLLGFSKSIVSMVPGLFEGFAAGGHWTHTGGGTNYQCLPVDPQWDSYSQNGHASPIYGAEYQTYGYSSSIPSSAHDQNVPCSRCHSSTRSAVLMIPARRDCPSGWTREYHGMSETS